MYRINKEKNIIEPLEKRSFTELNFRERDHLQEWIAKNPSSLGEELLIIQKEYAGFDKTNERLDLLALDKEGALVIIENKLDDSGKDVTWQAVKYASYCSGFSKESIVNIYQKYLDGIEPGVDAEKKIREFLEKKDDDENEELELNEVLTQRIILVAANFRPEVISAVLWLLNFNVQLKCFQATPYSMNDEIFLTIEQVIPTPADEEFIMKATEKNLDNIKSKIKSKKDKEIYKEFWSNLLPVINLKSTLFENSKPHYKNWFGAGVGGVSGISLGFVFSKSKLRIQLYIERSDKGENEYIFDELCKSKEKIEKDYGQILDWKRKDKFLHCRVQFEEPEIFSVSDKHSWDKMINLITDKMVKLENAFKGHLLTLKIIKKE